MRYKYDSFSNVRSFSLLKFLLYPIWSELETGGAEGNFVPPALLIKGI
jgi:hypothetical protein